MCMVKPVTQFKTATNLNKKFFFFSGLIITRRQADFHLVVFGHAFAHFKAFQNTKHQIITAGGERAQRGQHYCKISRYLTALKFKCSVGFQTLHYECVYKQDFSL